MAGPGIRAWELARVLAQKDHEVALLATEIVDPPDIGVRCRVATTSAIAEEIFAAEVVVIQASATHLLALADVGNRALVVDLYDPQIIEDLEIHRAAPMAERLHRHASAVATLAALAGRGDFFLCASERQRHLLLGELAAHGRVNPLNYEDDSTLGRLVAVVPFGLPDAPPAAGVAPVLRGVMPGIGISDKVVVWGGGLWNWFDPVTLVRAAARLSTEFADLRVVFMGSGHPNVSVPTMPVAAEARRVASELGVLGRAVLFREGWLPYADRGTFLSEADLAVSLHHPGIETLFAFRTRVLDYLWAGLPCVLTEGDVMAELAAAEAFGLICPAGDSEAVASAMRTLLTDQKLAADFRGSAQRVASRFQWSRVAEPLLEFCEAPRRSPDARLRLDTPRPKTMRGLSTLSRAWGVLRSEGPRRFAARAMRRINRRAG